jgi:hypothetical protein
LAIIGVLLLSMIVYVPALGGLPVWDDRAIMSGWGVGGGETFAQCFANPFLGHYFRPFTSLSYFLEMRLVGPNPMLMHQTNILLHAIATGLLVALTRALFNRPRLALVAGLAFAVQPAQVGTVAWIGGRCDQLGALLVILMALGLVRYHQTRSIGWLVAGVLAFFCAMMVKEQFAALGLMVPLAAFALRPKEEARRASLLTTAPFFAAGLVFVALWVFNYPDPNKAATFGLVEQVSRVGRATVNYSLLLLLPNPWSMHTFSMEAFRSPAIVGLGLALFAGLFAGTYLLWRRDPRVGWIATGALVGFLPVSNIVPIPSLISAPYRVGAIGPLIAVLIALALAAAVRNRRYVPAAILGLSVISGLVLTPWGSSKWVSESTLFGTFVAYDPNAITLRNCYIGALETEKHTDEALAQSAIVMDSLFGKGRWGDSRALPSLVKHDPEMKYRLQRGDGFGREWEKEISTVVAMRGHLLRQAHRDEDGRAALLAATAIDGNNGKAWSELGQDARERQDPEAIVYYSRALASNPVDSISASILAKLLKAEGRRARAVATLRRVLNTRPEFGEPLLDLAEMEIEDGQSDRARETLALARRTIVDTTRLQALWLKANRSVASRS